MRRLPSQSLRETGSSLEPSGGGRMARFRCLHHSLDCVQTCDLAILGGGHRVGCRISASWRFSVFHFPVGSAPVSCQSSPRTLSTWLGKSGSPALQSSPRKTVRRELVKQSKFLSLVLRHDPCAIGIDLDAAGWVNVATLLDALRRHSPQITRERLIEIVETNDKRRFAFSDDFSRIRASQGHSIGIDLDLPPSTPPSSLFHGTAAKNLTSIQDKGLLRGQRDHVHLSPDEETATQVGARHGKPVVLRIESGQMAGSGFMFYVSENGVWLTAHVPPTFIVFPDA